MPDFGDQELGTLLSKRSRSEDDYEQLMQHSLILSSSIEKLTKELETLKTRRELVVDILQNRSSSKEDEDVAN